MVNVKIYLELTCGDPGDVSGATKSGGYEFGDVVTYNCNPGYQLTSGDTRLQCQANQQWSGVKPICTSKVSSSGSQGNG